MKNLKNKHVDYLAVTDRAAKEIKEKIRDDKENFGIKVSIKTKGCSGMAYTIEFATAENISQYEELFEAKDVKIFIDPKVSLFLFNTELDFTEKKNDDGIVLESGFVFNNPNETGRCGCGESFYV
jgi:iron-sulfur cluster assembly protein